MTKPTPTVDIDPQASWMSPSRVEHQSKLVESVIFEPQPRIMLSRSAYKVTSFIDFMPYREAFKKFETFLRKFKNNINDPDHVGPLININATKGKSWKGPKEGFFRVRCKKNAYINVDWQDNSDSFEWKQIELQKSSMQSILNSLVQKIQWKIILLQGNLEKDRELVLREILTCLFNRTILVRMIWL